MCWPRKAPTQIGDSAGDENSVIMTDFSNPSNISSHEELLQEYRRECNQVDERLLLSCYHKTEQGVIKIKEWKPPSMIDLLKEVQSSDTLSDALSDFVQYLIDQEASSILVPVIQESVIEKPINNPCKDLSTCDVACQDTIRSSQVEIVDPKFSGKSTQTTSTSSTSMLEGQQNKSKDAGCTATGLTGSKTSLTGSSKILQNKSKPNMVKPKKPEIGV